MQPVLVRPSPTQAGRYEIIAGERRWRAAQRAGLNEIPVIVRDVNDRTALELAIIENVQRTDLNPVEEAMGYQQLIDEHGYTQADLGNVIGKSRSHVANTLRLLKLPDVIRDMLVDGALSAGHARTLVTAQDPAGLAKQIVEEGLSVRQAEALAQHAGRRHAAQGQAGAKRSDKDADTLALEKLLSDTIGLNVTIEHKDKGGEVRVPTAPWSSSTIFAGGCSSSDLLRLQGLVSRLINTARREPQPRSRHLSPRAAMPSNACHAMRQRQFRPPAGCSTAVCSRANARCSASAVQRSSARSTSLAPRRRRPAAAPPPRPTRRCGRRPCRPRISCSACICRIAAASTR